MRDACYQALGVGMLRGGQNVVDTRFLGFAPGVHHEHALRHFSNRPHVVRDQYDCRVGLLLEFLQQIEDLRLDRDIERSRRLVGDQNLRPTGKRHGDHDALTHPAGKLMRVVVDALFGGRDRDRTQHLDGPVSGIISCETFMQANGLRNLFTNGIDRVERGHGLLEDH